MFTQSSINTILTVILGLVLFGFLDSAKAQEFNFKVVAGVATFHPFGDGEYQSFEKITYQWRDRTYQYRYVENKQYNNNTNLIGIEYKDFLIGTFKNSYYNRSYIVAYRFLDEPIFNYGVHEISLTSHLGITHGYRAGKDIPEKMCFTQNLCPSVSVGIEYSYDNNYFINTSAVSNSINITLAKAISIK
jgi:hypothetical protein